MKKSVLITGASKGLGAALAGELAGAGARVVMVARHADELEKAAARIGAYALAADIGDKHAVHAIAGAAAALVGPIEDRKSTRLNSSHMSISYAVFCLKKKKHNKILGET